MENNFHFHPVEYTLTVVTYYVHGPWKCNEYVYTKYNIR